jgi:hypothetical protein
MLIEELGLHPSIEVRLASVAKTAVDCLARAVSDADALRYTKHKRDLDAAVAAIDELRVLRQGAGPIVTARTM